MPVFMRSSTSAYLLLVGTGQLDQQHLIGSLRGGCRQPLLKLRQLL